ncbi:MAG: hypothetical protein NPIRA04_18330 [Nitrospirales bacterium]|nr:MAG: hypothetical protein NPIRA04_18330 [Nitrospirales bacterium]
METAVKVTVLAAAIAVGFLGISNILWPLLPSSKLVPVAGVIGLVVALAINFFLRKKK